MWHAGRNRRNHVSLHSNHPIIFSDQTHIWKCKYKLKNQYVYKDTQYMQKNVTLTGKEETTYPTTQTTLSYFQIRHINIYRCKFKYKFKYQYVYTQYIQINVTLAGKEETVYPSTFTNAIARSTILLLFFVFIPFAGRSH